MKTISELAKQSEEQHGIVWHSCPESNGDTWAKEEVEFCQHSLCAKCWAKIASKVPAVKKELLDDLDVQESEVEG